MKNATLLLTLVVLVALGSFLWINPFESPVEISQEVMVQKNVQLISAKYGFELAEADQVTEVAIYNMVGQKVHAYIAVPGRPYSLSGLPKGTYLVSLLDNNKQVIKTFKINRAITIA